MSKHFNYFSEGEQKSIHKFSDLRTKVFRPIAKFLDKIYITPNVVSITGLLVMIGFIYFININTYYALIFVAIHVLLDGPLARYQNRSSNSGALLDIFVDQACIVVAILATIYYGITHPFWSAYFITSYIVMIMLLVLLNHLNKPVKFVIRSKYYFFVILGLDAYFHSDIMTPFLAVLAIYMTFASIHMFNKLRCLV